ncbi:MAG TPA: hypothetical protein VMU05_12970, partial [Dongiaceae bacterium]|nr:hypothetical protein [Dongiaceae bacterium]
MLIAVGIESIPCYFPAIIDRLRHRQVKGAAANYNRFDVDHRAAVFPQKRSRGAKVAVGWNGNTDYLTFCVNAVCEARGVSVENTKVIDLPMPPQGGMKYLFARVVGPARCFAHIIDRNGIAQLAAECAEIDHF